MISVKKILTWILWKAHQQVAEGRLYIRKIEIISLGANKSMGRVKNFEIFNFWIDFWMLLNPSFSIFYMLNFQIVLFPGSPDFWPCTRLTMYIRLGHFRPFYGANSVQHHQTQLLNIVLPSAHFRNNILYIINFQLYINYLDIYII